jgi:hypothetical protein
MRSLNRIFTISMLAFAFILAMPKITKAQDDGYISDQEFYDQLAPYGTWVQDDYYGDVWIPNVDQDFRPYATDGYWAQTEYGSTWVSDYPWGWATFHYGRWHYDDYYGWEWIPGHEWAPAWVSWRHGGGYYGWAPLDAGITVSMAFGNGYHVPDNYWVCAPEAYINSPRIYNYYVPHSRWATIINHTAIINNTYVHNNRTYITGPRPADIQKVTHHPVTVYKISNASKPGAINVQHNAISIYRPAVRKTPNARPARVVNAGAYKQANPTAGIGRTGGVANNHGNAQKLSLMAHSTKPDTRIVNTHPTAPAPNHSRPQGSNAPGQPANNNRPAQAGGVNPGQPANNNHAPARPQQPAITQPNPAGQQQPVQNNGHKGNSQHRQPQAPGQQPVQPAQQQAVTQPNPAGQQQPVQNNGHKGNFQHRQPQAPGQQPVQPAQQQQQQAQQQQRAQQQVQQQAQQRQQQQQQQQQKAQQQQQQQAQRQQQQAQQQQQRAQQQQQQQAQRQQQQAQQQQQRAQQQQQQAQRQQQQAQQQQQQAQQRAQQQARQQQQRQQRPPQPRPQPQPQQKPQDQH